ncbi:MAG: neutral/alkaline non-lysosomal ceramidase N-terminal domain-containing protein [bacterium]
MKNRMNWKMMNPLMGGIVLIGCIALSAMGQTLKVGTAEMDITPPNGFPMAGYYHERLAEGVIDPLKARAMVFSGNGEKAAMVAMDLCGVTTDLADQIRKGAAEETGMKYENIVVSATHSHTSPDYYKTLHDYLAGEKGDAGRIAYVQKLIGNAVAAIEKADKEVVIAKLAAGSVLQETPVAFNRRFVMKDGSVQTWQSLKSPNVLKSAGPIDPEIGLVAVKNADGKMLGVLSNFALHLDTVGGTKWSGDYPYFIEKAVRQVHGQGCVSFFGTGCCGDINHSNPDGSARNKTDMIGGTLGQTIVGGLEKLPELKNTRLVVKNTTVKLPLQECGEKEVAESLAILEALDSGQKVEFLKQVWAHKMLMIDQLRHTTPLAAAKAKKPFLRTRKLAGVGEVLPVEVTTIAVGDDLAIVCLPGEVFVNLGLAIKQNSPYKTTLIVELSNSVETIYIPTRAAHAGGSYEVTNSTVKPGSGEMLVEAALGLLRQSRGTSGKP